MPIPNCRDPEARIDWHYSRSRSRARRLSRATIAKVAEQRFETVCARAPGLVDGLRATPLAELLIHVANVRGGRPSSDSKLLSRACCGRMSSRRCSGHRALQEHDAAFELFALEALREDIARELFMNACNRDPYLNADDLDA